MRSDKLCQIMQVITYSLSGLQGKNSLRSISLWIFYWPRSSGFAGFSNLVWRVGLDWTLLSPWSPCFPYPLVCIVSSTKFMPSSSPYLSAPHQKLLIMEFNSIQSESRILKQLIVYVGMAWATALMRISLPAFDRNLPFYPAMCLPTWSFIRLKAFLSRLMEAAPNTSCGAL